MENKRWTCTISDRPFPLSLITIEEQKKPRPGCTLLYSFSFLSKVHEHEIESTKEYEL
jgi:hypothetical protein